ncbi:uncharacterized protein LOC119730640 [Patiria miniata]|uniref:Ig-like domain-containing protein n=1 Tax=Patiria miniata TaxID=46514 RepID=A0A914A6Y5_PATMI|nr:uncharacterized protein LOC119730640 [Patiria miniata]
MMLASMMSPIGLVLVMLLYTAEGRFTSHPRSQTVYEGQHVRFTCGSAYMILCHYPSFRWYRSTTSHPSQQYVSGCIQVDPSLRNRMTVELDILTRVFHLDIQNVQLQDGGQYWCQLFYFQNSQSNRNSSKATLTVIPRPPPSCMVTSPSNHKVGDSVSFTCTLAETDPSAAITWYINSSSGHHPLSSIREVREGRVSRVNRVLQATDNMKEFVCVAGPDFNTGPRCSVTPLQIPTNVSISPTFQSVYEGDSAVFTCNVEAIPPPTGEEYRWRIYKTNESGVTDQGVMLTSFDGRFNMIGNTLEILAVSTDFHNSYVTCRAIYPQGSSISIDGSRLTVLSVTTVLSPTSSAATATIQETKDPNVPETEETHFGANTPNQRSTSSSIMATISSNEPKQDGDTSQKLPIGVLVGGALAILLLLVTILLLVCFLVRNKRNVRRPRQVVTGSPVQESARQDIVTAGSSVETDLAYLNLPRDYLRQPTRTNMLPEETTECEGDLYAIPDKTGSREVKHFTMTPPANKTSTGPGFVSLPRNTEPASSNGHGSHEMVVYAQVNKNIKRYPKPSADKPAVGDTQEMASSLQDQASRDEDTEEPEYADLDFNQVPQGAAGIDAIYAKPHKGPKK